MQQSLSQFNCGAAYRREGSTRSLAAVGEAYAVKNSAHVVSAAITEAVDMSLMPEIFVGGEFGIDARAWKTTPTGGDVGGICRGIHPMTMARPAVGIIR